MKIIKRLISLLIIVSMVATGTGFVLAADSAKDECGLEELGLVNALGITEYEAEDLSKVLTRGNFLRCGCVS